MATCSVILKCLKTWDRTLITSIQYSGTPYLARMISETWWKTMPKEIVYCLNLQKCWYPASHYKMEHLLLLCCCFIYIWVFFAQKYTVLLGKLRRNASTALCSQQWTREGEMTKVQTQVSSQKQLSFQPTAPTLTRSWTGADTLQRSISTKKHMQLITVNCSRS